jgi:hypothetical protein
VNLSARGTICKLACIGAEPGGFGMAGRQGGGASCARRRSWRACERQLSSDRRCVWCGSRETGKRQVYIVSWWCEVLVWIPMCLYLSVHGCINSELISCASSYLVLHK